MTLQSFIPEIKPKKIIGKIIISSTFLVKIICINFFLFYFLYNSIKISKTIDQNLSFSQKFSQTISQAFKFLKQAILNFSSFQKSIISKISKTIDQNLSFSQKFSQTISQAFKFLKQAILNFSSFQKSIISILLIYSLFNFITSAIPKFKSNQNKRKDCIKNFFDIIKTIIPFLIPIVALSIPQDSKALFISLMIISVSWIFTNIISFMLVCSSYKTFYLFYGDCSNFIFYRDYKNDFLKTSQEDSLQKYMKDNKLAFLIDLSLDFPRKIFNLCIDFIEYIVNKFIDISIDKPCAWIKSQLVKNTIINNFYLIIDSILENIIFKALDAIIDGCQAAFQRSNSILLTLPIEAICRNVDNYLR